jgi:brefeldin A-resistance guanine nucleotide exchange factor 1
VPVVLHTMSSLKKDMFVKAAPLILKGLTQCINDPTPLRNEIMTSPDFWVILRNLAADPQSAPMVFGILEGVVEIESPPTIMADNYESATNLLNDFASAGSIKATIEQKPDKRTRRGQPIKQEKKPKWVIACDHENDEADILTGRILL